MQQRLSQSPSTSSWDKSAVTSLASSAHQPEASALEHFVCAVANNTWRLCKKLADHGNELKLMRHVDALKNALTNIGVCVKDHDGERYDVGMAVKVIAWEQRPNATKEEIVETIKPSIRWNDKLLQWGEVIACVPVKEAGTEQRKGE